MFRFQNDQNENNIFDWLALRTQSSLVVAAIRNLFAFVGHFIHAVSHSVYFEIRNDVD